MQVEIWQLILGFIATLLSGRCIVNLENFIARILRERRADKKENLELELAEKKENWALEKDRFEVINEHKDQLIRELRRELKEKKNREIKKSLTEIDFERENPDS